MMMGNAIKSIVELDWGTIEQPTIPTINHIESTTLKVVIKYERKYN